MSGLSTPQKRPKTLDNFDFLAVPMISKAHVMALASGDTCSVCCVAPAMRPTSRASRA
jgi:hypothetical protein